MPGVRGGARSSPVGGKITQNFKLTHYPPYRLLDYAWPSPVAVAWSAVLRALVGGVGTYLRRVQVSPLVLRPRY